MKDILKIIITNTIVYGGVFAALRLLYQPSKNANRFTVNQFTAEYSTAAKIIVIICFLVSVFFVVMNYGNLIGKWGIGKGFGVLTSVVFTMMFLMSLLCIMLIIVWKVNVKNDNVYYRNYYGVTKVYSAEEITEVRKKKSGATIVYKGPKKIFVIDESLKMGNYYFELWAQEHNIPIIQRVTK